MLASRGELEQAESLAREAVKIGAETDYFDLHAGALLDLAEVLRGAAKAGEARTALEEAVALYERKGNLVGAARAKAALEEP